MMLDLRAVLDTPVAVLLFKRVVYISEAQDRLPSPSDYVLWSTGVRFNPSRFDLPLRGWVSLLARLHGQFAENREIKRSRWEQIAELHGHEKVVYADMEVDFSRKEISWRVTEPTVTGLELMTAMSDPEYIRVDRLCRSYRSLKVADGVEWLVLRCLYAELIDVSCAQEYYFVLEGHLFKRAFSGSVSHLGCMTPTIV